MISSWVEMSLSKPPADLGLILISLKPTVVYYGWPIKLVKSYCNNMFFTDVGCFLEDEIDYWQIIHSPEIQHLGEKE
jgi:hypothetical protein